MMTQDMRKDPLDFDDGELKYNKTLATSHYEGMGRILPGKFFNMRREDWKIVTILGVLGLLVRFYKISQPDSVVFDEVHFGGFASKYIQRNYFFDVHPPLAKLMISAVAWVKGFDGSFDFSDIGKTFVGSDVPYIAMRSTQAFFGWLLIPTSYITAKTIGMTSETSALTSFLIIFENSLVTQSRFILLDSPLLFFTAGAVLSWLNFCNQSRNPFSNNWWYSLLTTGIFLGLNLSCKWVGLFTVALVGFSTVQQLWDFLGDLKITPKVFFRHFFARALCLILVPAVIYLASFQIHFMVLKNYTEAASSMSPEFQNTLNGHGLVDAKQDVIYGSKIRIAHVATNGGYLHSHDHTYPGGSNQQQITLYPFRDDNNFWIIEKSTENNTEVAGNEYIMNQDIVRLRHVTTQKRLHSHDVRPIFSDKAYINEVSGYTWPDSNDNFRVDIMRGDGRNSSSTKQLMAIYSRFRLIHVNTGCVLYSRPEKLPEWGFKQQQVFCIRDGMRPRSEWVIETNLNDQLVDSPIVSYDRMGFFSKFFEINSRMWSTNSALVASHPFDSRPSSWPFLKRGISFWGKNQAQVYLLGNPLTWYAGTLAVLLYFSSQIVVSLFEKRNIRFPLQGLQAKYYSDVGFLAMGWCLHYLPFFLMKRQLFLHHYLPALYFSILAFTATLDLFTRRLKARFRLGTTAAFALLAFWMFIKFSPLVYGLHWSKETCASNKFGKKWDFDCNSMK